MKLMLAYILLCAATILSAQNFSPKPTKMCELSSDQLRAIGIVAQADHAYFVEPAASRFTSAKKTVITPNVIQFLTVGRHKKEMPSKFQPVFTVIEYDGGSASYFRSKAHYEAARTNKSEYSPEAIRYFTTPDNLIGVRFRLGSANAAATIVSLWYVPTPEFLDALPKVYRNEIHNADTNADSIAYTQTNTDNKIYFDFKSIAPNPAANGSCSAIIDVRGTASLSLSLFDIAGRKILDFGNFQFSQGEQTIPMNFGELQSGMYIVGVQSEEGQTAFQRLMVTR